MPVGEPEPKTVVCPSCSGPSVYAASNPFRPFCCERCKMNDFGSWASERFRMPAQDKPDGDLGSDASAQ